jgi:hypothetical protein
MNVKDLSAHLYIQHAQYSTTWLSTHGNLWTEIPCYTVFQFTVALGILPQIVVKKQWCYIRDWLHKHNFLVTLILIRKCNYCASTFVFCAWIVPAVTKKSCRCFEVCVEQHGVFLYGVLFYRKWIIPKLLKAKLSSFLNHTFLWSVFCFVWNLKFRYQFH